MSERYTAPMPVCVECCRGVGDTSLHDAWHASTTPAPEAAAAPAVDDLGSIIRWLCAETRNMLTEDEMSDLVASEPMQRLRAAWIAEAEAENVQQAFELVKLRAENASLREQVDGRLRDNDVASEALQNAWRERDEARAEAKERRQAADYFDSRYQEQQAKTRAAEATVERLRAAQQTGDLEERLWRVLREFAPHPFPDNLVDAVKQLCDQARAAQLPDVGPVTRGSDETGGGFWVDGVHFGEWSGRSYLREGARYLAVAAFLDAEAADASSDDEGVLPDPEDLAEVVAALDEEFGSPSRNVTWADVVREIDAHRARGGQEAGR